jgi:NarL family two-component system response regulator YdfI
LNSASGLRNNSLPQSSPSTRTRTLVIAGSQDRRARLERWLRGTTSIEVVGVLPGAAGANAYVEHWRPEAVIIDLEPNPGNAESLLAVISTNFPKLAVIVLAENLEAAPRMLRSGVSSILERDSSREQIAAAIQAAVEELIVLQPEIMNSLLGKSTGRDAAVTELLLEELTRREVEVLGMVAAGLANREIASRLGVSEHTIKFHISSILGKLGASSRTEAVTCGIKRGLILL